MKKLTSKHSTDVQKLKRARIYREWNQKVDNNKGTDFILTPNLQNTRRRKRVSHFGFYPPNFALMATPQL